MMGMMEPTIAELAAKAGASLVILDAEHGFPTGFDVRPFINAVHVSGGKCLLRIAQSQVGEIGPMLDRGMDGLVISGVATLEEMLRLGELVWYPPLGRRSVNPFVAAAPVPGDEHGMRVASGKLELWAMGESAELLSLARSERDGSELVRGWTGILVGPYDLAVSLDLEMDPKSSTFLSAVSDLVAFAQVRGLEAGIFCRNESVMEAWWEEGIRTELVVLGYDRDIWYSEILRRVRRGAALAKAEAQEKNLEEDYK